MTPQQIALLRHIADAVTDAVAAAGSAGAPSGTLYAALMAQGCTLSQYESIMSGLVRAGRLTRSGHLYFVAGGR